ncbi:cell division protein FtsL [Variovorax sp. JS1663]|uniref:cell division protein FtsL n=1 Tax=Variovorax sp. JS1663 TaxID=1851577 RepID=UPI000B3484DA|nr:cell division protein FtsL [Variovorax sp. JS1663]OUM02354.1 cell division protein FtsL [Variovorax sp. JS1663]
MVRLNLLLLMAVLASAIYLVHTQYLSRQLFTELHRVQNETRRLELDRDRLEVEKRAQATPLRVERLAKEQLKMRTTTPAITQYVRADGTVIPAVAAPAPAPGTPVARGTTAAGQRAATTVPAARRSTP